MLPTPLRGVREEATAPAVLLVDDRPANLLALEAILESLGPHLVMAGSGQEALEAVEREDFALVLLDMMMPGMDGLETARRIKASPRARRTPIVFVTAVDPDADLLARAYAAGAADYVVKPFNVEVLRAKVSVFTELFKRGAELEEQRIARAREREARRHAERLQAVTGALSEAATYKAIVDVVLDQGLALLGGMAAMLYLADGRKPGTFGLAGSRGISEDAQAALAHVPLDGATPVAVVGRTGRAAFVESIEAYRAEFPESAERLAASTGVQAFACVPLRTQGGLRGAAAIAFDGPRRFSEEERAFLGSLAWQAAQALDRARLLENEKVAKRAAEEANRLKDEFLATVSHELRTPLTAILGWLDILRRGGRDDPARLAKALEVIDRNARAQASLVEDILDVSRIVTGKLALEPRTIDLCSLFHETIEVVRPAADAKGVALGLEGCSEPAPYVGDPTRLRQVLWNLLTNAIKFTPRGGRVVGRVRRQPAVYVLEVADSGSGIDASKLPHVFDRFWQGDSSTTRAVGGLGLGLAIVRHIVEMHGGTVGALSAGPGAGATFTATLPRRGVSAETQVPPRRRRRRRRDGQPDRRLEGIRVLVVEDDDDAREALAVVLATEHAAVRGAHSAAEALRALDDFDPDIVLSDIGMPDQDGHWLAERLRRLRPELPTVALTAYARPVDAERALAAGFRRHLVKPVEPGLLVDTVARLLRGTGRRSAS